MVLFWSHKEAEEKSPCFSSKTFFFCILKTHKVYFQLCSHFVTIKVPACPSFQYSPCPTLSFLCHFSENISAFYPSVLDMKHKNKTWHMNQWSPNWHAYRNMCQYITQYSTWEVAVKGCTWTKNCCDVKFKWHLSFPSDSPALVNKQLLISACESAGA